MSEILIHKGSIIYMGMEKEINNIQKYNINNGFVERKNNKIKVIKRLSYGIKNSTTLKSLFSLGFLKVIELFSTPTLDKDPKN